MDYSPVNYNTQYTWTKVSGYGNTVRSSLVNNYNVKTVVNPWNRIPGLERPYGIHQPASSLKTVDYLKGYKESQSDIAWEIVNNRKKNNKNNLVEEENN